VAGPPTNLVKVCLETCIGCAALLELTLLKHC
jgi:hypothetical protein